MKDSNLLLNSDIDSEFLILISKKNQSFKVEGKSSYYLEFMYSSLVVISLKLCRVWSIFHICHFMFFLLTGIICET